MTETLRLKLQLKYLIIGVILNLLSFFVYFNLSQYLSQSLDKKLPILVQIASPCLSKIKQQREKQQRKNFLPEVNRVSPLKDNCNVLLNPEQTLEWFDENHKLLDIQGNRKLGFSPTEMGFVSLPQKQIQTYTQEVYAKTINRQPYVVGYIRISQSTQGLENSQNLLNLGVVILITLQFIGLIIVWLTQIDRIKIQRLNQQLKQFIDDVSHELRSPLTAIQAGIELMRNHPERIHPKDIKKLAAIANSTTQMTHLTEDLLLLVRADGKRLTTPNQSTPIILSHLFEDLLDLLEPLAENKGIVLTYDCQAKPSILGNQAQINRLFANLLENAIQYTPPGGRVTLRLLQQNSWAVIRLEDTGIGIAKKELAFVFNRFWRGDNARSRRTNGTGLGLAIAQAIAQNHGGKITVNSQLDIGSCFQVSLPLIDALT